MNGDMVPKMTDGEIESAWQIYRECNKDSDNLPTVASNLDDAQYRKAKLIAHLFQGHTFGESATLCGMSSIKARLMCKYDDALRDAVELERDVRLSEASDTLERKVWARAMDDDRRDSMLLAMYALKSKRAEYRDNYTPDSNRSVSVVVNVDGQRFDADFVPTEDNNNG